MLTLNIPLLEPSAVNTAATVNGSVPCSTDVTFVGRKGTVTFNVKAGTGGMMHTGVCGFTGHVHVPALKFSNVTTALLPSFGMQHNHQY